MNGWRSKVRRSSTAAAPLEVVDNGPDSGGSARAPEQGLRTEFSFILPRGYVDGAGTVHRDGVMRLGTIDDVHAGMIENLFASDLAFLQDLYRRINQEGHTRAAVTCPNCEHQFAVDIAGGRLGE